MLGIPGTQAFGVPWPHGETKARVVTSWLADELVSLAKPDDEKFILVTRCVCLG